MNAKLLISLRTRSASSLVFTMPLTFVAALTLGISGCSQAEKEKEPVVSVQTTPAERNSISQVITAEAVVFPLQQAVITPKITSTVRKFYVKRSSRVRQGQLLAELENRDLEAAAAQSKAEYAQAEAGYATTVGASLPEQIQKAELDANTAKAALDAQQKVYDSRKTLFDQGALPRRDLDSAQVALVQARSQSEVAQKQFDDLKRLGEQQALKSASGQRGAAEAKYQSAQAQLSYSRIYSPIDGVVTERPLFEGELATANQPLLTVMNVSRLVAKAHIAQVDAAILKVGDPAELKFPGGDEPVKARVSLVSPALDPGSTTVEVWVETAKPNPALRPGMTVQSSITAKTANDAIVVPKASIFKTSEGADYVMLAGSDGHAHQKNVQLGIRGDDRVQIVSGINPGDPVISSGGYALPDNTQIKIEAPASAEEDAGGKGSADKDKDKGDDDPKPGDAVKVSKKGKE